MSCAGLSSVCWWLSAVLQVPVPWGGCLTQCLAQVAAHLLMSPFLLLPVNHRETSLDLGRVQAEWVVCPSGNKANPKLQVRKLSGSRISTCNVQSEMWFRVLGRAAQPQRCSIPVVPFSGCPTGIRVLHPPSANALTGAEQHLKGVCNHRWGLAVVGVLLLKSNLIG